MELKERNVKINLLYAFLYCIYRIHMEFCFYIYKCVCILDINEIQFPKNWPFYICILKFFITA